METVCYFNCSSILHFLLCHLISVLIVLFGDQLLILFSNNLLLFFRPGGIPARNVKGERLLLFIGIIDILQSYRLKKKLEHTWKSMIHDGVSIE